MITRRILNQLSKIGYQITNFTYKNSINDLPKLSFQAKKQKEIQIIDNFFNSPNFKITDFNLKITDINNDTTYEYLNNLEFNLIQRDIEGNYQYEQFHNFRYPANLNTQTLCKIYIDDILYYYLNKLNCLPEGFNDFYFDVDWIAFRKFDIDNKSLIDILNHLQEYGYYWYVWEDNIYINSYTNLMPQGTIELIQPQIQTYKNQETSMVLIKEPSHQEYPTKYTYKLPQAYNLTYEIKLDKPLKFNSWNVFYNLDLGNLQPTDYYAIRVYAYDSKTNKIASIYRFQQHNGTFYPESAIAYVSKDGFDFYFVYIGPLNLPKCAGNPLVLTCLANFTNPCYIVIGNATYDCDNNPNEIDLYSLDYGDCYDTIIIKYYGNKQIGPNNYFELKMGVSLISDAYCLPSGLDNNCIEVNDFEFTQQIHKINSNNCYKIPEKRFSNIIYNTDWNNIINYYNLLVSSPEFFEIRSYIFPEYIQYFGNRVDLVYNIQYNNIEDIPIPPPSSDFPIKKTITFKNFLFKEIEITPQGIVGVFGYPI
jgi:hypothetical protein